MAVIKPQVEQKQVTNYNWCATPLLTLSMLGCGEHAGEGWGLPQELPAQAQGIRLGSTSPLGCGKFSVGGGLPEVGLLYGKIAPLRDLFPPICLSFKIAKRK